MCDLGLRGKRNLLAFYADLLIQEPGAGALPNKAAEHKASGGKLNNILKEEHITTQRPLTTTIRPTISRAITTGHTVQQRTKNAVFPQYSAWI